MSDGLSAFVARAREKTVRQELERRGLWTRAMHGQSGVPCPGCGGRDRFSVHQGKDVFFCRASGAGGDALALVQHLDGCDFLTACEIVSGEKRPDGRGESEADRLARQRRQQEERAKAARERARADAEFNAFREAERRRCFKVWRDAGPIDGTAAEAYLAARGLYAPAGARLRFAPRLGFWHGNAMLGAFPAMVGAMVGPDGRFAGVHETFLDPVAAKKASVIDPVEKQRLDAKKTRGSWAGATVDLMRVERPARCFLGEGIETVLSVFCALAAAHPPLLAGAEFRSACNLGNIAGKAENRVAHPSERIARQDGRDGGPRKVGGEIPAPAERDLPMVFIADSVSELFLLGDGDSDPFVTALALRRAAARFSRAYPWLTIKLAMAKPGADFNDMLLGAAAEKHDGTEIAA